MSDHLPLKLAQIEPVIAHRADERQARSEFSAQDLRGKLGATRVDDEPKPLPHLLQRQRLAIRIHELFQKVDRVAQAACRRSRYRLQAVLGTVDLFLCGDKAEALDDGRERDAAEIESLAAGDDRGRHFVRLGGGENEHHVRGRLL